MKRSRLSILPTSLLAALTLATGCSSEAFQDGDTSVAAVRRDAEGVEVTALERSASGEKQITEEIAARIKNTVAKELQEQQAAGVSPAVAHRDAHAKHHGCVKAKFEVASSLPEGIRNIGVFQEGKAYDSWIRFSNGQGRVKSDGVDDARGMAIKLLGVPGEKFADKDSGSQDFVMINYPAFFVRDAASYLEFTKASEGSPLRFFIPGVAFWNWRVHELLTARAITRQDVSSPIDLRYFSMVSYMLRDKPMKFSAKPCDRSVSKAFAEHPEWKDTSDPDFMRKRLASELQTGDQCYVFQVQPRADIASDGDIRSQVEDSTNIWDEAQFPFVDVARITIPKQEFDTPEQQTYCENLSFTPWHAVAEQRPLGVMNRIRRVVYETISATRHELNGAPRREPVDMSVPPLAPR